MSPIRSACESLLAHLMLASPLSSLKLALMAALSFCTTARSSAIVLEARTLLMNCFTVNVLIHAKPKSAKSLYARELMAASRTPDGQDREFAASTTDGDFPGN
jgi:hypothetical protein